MDFPLASRVASRLEYVSEAGSTNDELVERANALDSQWGDLSVFVTDNQTMGRGRLGRTWAAPQGKSLAISVLVRPRLADGSALPIASIGWLSLLAGAAMTATVRAIVEPYAARLADEADSEASADLEVSLKWPNDVHISGYKVCGVLAELLPDAAGAVIGAGLNLALDEHDLPTLTSTSLLLATGTAPDPDAVLADYLARFAALYRDLLAAGGDAGASGLRANVRELCGTIGRAVRVELPGDAELIGRALDIDAEGRLLVENLQNGEVQAVAAGDVTHLRY